LGEKERKEGKRRERFEIGRIPDAADIDVRKE
jgi:hypothetical protein